MENSYRLYPYPVLSKDSDDYLTTSFTADASITIKNGFIELTLSASTDNDELRVLISEGYAKIGFHLECSQTGYRTFVAIKENSKPLSILESKINGRLQACPFIIATKQIKSYKNKDFNSAYNGFTFDLDSGCIMGVSESFEFSIIKNTDELAFIPSIFYITSHQDEKFRGMDINISQDRIGILLEQQLFEQYKLLNGNSEIQKLLVSLIIIPALVFVLQTLKNADQEEMDSYEMLRWYQTIKNSLMKLSINLDENANALKDNSQSTVLLAQQIIDFPILGSLLELSNILGLSNQVEED
jgi:hypothetical protein